MPTTSRQLAHKISCTCARTACKLTTRIKSSLSVLRHAVSTELCVYTVVGLTLSSNSPAFLFRSERFLPIKYKIECVRRKHVYFIYRKDYLVIHRGLLLSQMLWTVHNTQINTTFTTIPVIFGLIIIIIVLSLSTSLLKIGILRAWYKLYIVCNLITSSK